MNELPAELKKVHRLKIDKPGEIIFIIGGTVDEAKLFADGFLEKCNGHGVQVRKLYAFQYRAVQKKEKHLVLGVLGRTEKAVNIITLNVLSVEVHINWAMWCREVKYPERYRDSGISLEIRVSGKTGLEWRNTDCRYEQ
jgi:hypothetical protein